MSLVHTNIAGKYILDLLLPPHCLSCGTLQVTYGGLCAPCWKDLHFLAGPCCAQCGIPFPYDLGPEAKCAGCIASPPAFDAARAVLRYDQHSGALVSRFKYGDAIHTAAEFARWMARAGAPLLEEGELIVPAPLHWRRLFSRRYNQAALLARALSKIAMQPVALDLLRRVRHTAPQAELPRARRLDNVRNAFAVPQGKENRIAGRAVLLVDDVMTTGATMHACARALKKAGAARVLVLALARAVKEDG